MTAAAVREGSYQSIAFQVPASICRATVLSGDCGNGGRVQMLAAVHFIVGSFSLLMGVLHLYLIFLLFPASSPLSLGDVDSFGLWFICVCVTAVLLVTELL